MIYKPGPFRYTSSKGMTIYIGRKWLQQPEVDLIADLIEAAERTPAAVVEVDTATGIVTVLTGEIIDGEPEHTQISTQ